MKAGYVPFLTAPDDSKSDLELYREAMALADLVEGYWIVAAPHGRRQLTLCHDIR